MTSASADYYVVGFSVAGVSAALTLAAGGRRVEILEIENDLSLREQFQIARTAISPTAMAGSDYEDLARQRLESSGIILGSGRRIVELGRTAAALVAEVVDYGSASRRVLELDYGRCVYAPNGVPDTMPLLELPGAERAFGFGLSLSAWADAPFYRGGSVVVVGDTDWALEQAAFAIRFAVNTLLVTRWDSLVPRHFPSEVLVGRPLEFITHSEVTGICFGTGNTVSGIEFSREGRPDRAAVDAIFAAPTIIAPPDLDSGQGSPRLARCGLVNSIEYNSYAELQADGIRTAESILSR
jgi:thioredoxin reductase